MKLAVTTDELIGTIAPPVDSDVFRGPVENSLGIIIGRGILLFIILASLFMLLYMLWGAFDWVISSGEKERISKAQQKITHAVFGFIVIFVVLSAYLVITGTIFNIVETGPNGFLIKLPHF